MTYTFTIDCFNHRCIELEYNSISASGRLNPVLCLDLQARAIGAAKSVFVNDLWIEIRYQNELIGRGKFIATTFNAANKIPARVLISLTHQSLDLITNSLPGNASSLDLEVRFTGSILVEENTDDPQISNLQYSTNEMPKLGQFCLVPVSDNSSSRLTVERSTWYSSVLSATRHESYNYLEVALPNSLNQTDLTKEFQAALTLLRGAEKSYAQGDDASVFLKLRGWLDNLPGAKKEILSGIADVDKRKHLDNLLNSFGKYLHDGRHVSEDTGQFPVDHLDAAFALDMTRVLLSHLSLMLTAEERRRQ